MTRATTTTAASTSTTAAADLPAPAGWVWAAAAGAAIWAVGFALVNLYLQVTGIDDARLQANWTQFTVLNLSVAALKVFGAGVALATVTGWGHRLPAVLVSITAWGAAATLLLYSLYGAVAVTWQGMWTARMTAGGTFEVPVLGYLLFFLVPGILFALAAADHQRRTGTSRVTVLLGALGAPLILASVAAGLSAVG